MLDQSTVRRRRLGPVRRTMMVFAVILAGLGAQFVAPTAAHAVEACNAANLNGKAGQYICEYEPQYVTWPDGHHQWFIIGTDRRVYDSWEYGAGWSNWRSLGGDAHSAIWWSFPTSNTIEISVWGTTEFVWCKKSNANGTWPTYWHEC